MRPLGSSLSQTHKEKRHKLNLLASPWCTGCWASCKAKDTSVCVCVCVCKCVCVCVCVYTCVWWCVCVLCVCVCVCVWLCNWGEVQRAAPVSGTLCPLCLTVRLQQQLTSNRWSDDLLTEYSTFTW